MVGGRVCPLRVVVFVHGQRCCARQNLAGFTSGIQAASATDFLSPGPYPFTDFRIFCCNSDFSQLVAFFVNYIRMQPRQLGFRPLQTPTTACSFIFTGRGAALLVHHSILEFLYTPDTVNLDILRLGGTAAACWVASSRWTQVDTPSLATQVSSADSTP